MDCNGNNTSNIIEDKFDWNKLMENFDFEKLLHSDELNVYLNGIETGVRAQANTENQKIQTAFCVVDLTQNSVGTKDKKQIDCREAGSSQKIVQKKQNKIKNKTKKRKVPKSDTKVLYVIECDGTIEILEDDTIPDTSTQQQQQPEEQIVIVDDDEKQQKL